VRRVVRGEGVIRDQGGAAYVEFLISFMPLFFMFMGMVQMALMYAGDLVVQHAASRAARAAAVVLDDDPERYDGQRRRAVDDGGGGSENALGDLVGIFGGGSAGGGGGDAPGGPRMAAIRTAASAPLMAISPSMDQLTGGRHETVGDAIGSASNRGAVGALMYNRSAMGVTFPTSPGAESYRDTFPRGRNVQVVTRVTYLFHCGIPLANRLMCESYMTLRLGPAAAAAEGIIADLGSGSLNFDDAMARLERIDQSRRRHERDEAAVEELESAGANDMMYLTAGRGSRFKVLRGEASMPLQYAGYRYPSE